MLVGEDPASQVYVRTKAKATRGRRHAVVRAQAAGRRRAEAALLALIAELNARPDVHGILVQLPLPAHIDARQVIEAIDPAKDVDGFHPINVGRLASGAQGAGALHAVGLRDAGQVRAARSRRAWRRW